MDKNGCTEKNRLFMESWLQMIRTYDHLQSKVSSLLQDHGLTIPQFELLSTLAAADCTNQQELADRLQVTKGNLVGLIDRMTEKGWLERNQVPGDRRVNKVSITKTGKDLIHKALPEQARIVESMMSELTHEEVETLRTLLQKLAKKE